VPTAISVTQFALNRTRLFFGTQWKADENKPLSGLTRTAAQKPDGVAAAPHRRGRFCPRNPKKPVFTESFKYFAKFA
jgi:hypothetical protein